jgi:hypothetical protein
MHGYAHNRACQLSHHPKYTEGAGIEDFETCERIFSVSNNCAGISRCATAFHRHQLIDTHFHDSNESRLLALGKFIYDNYSDCLQRISRLSETFQRLDLLTEVSNGTFKKYLESEHKHLLSLHDEHITDQSCFKYVESLHNFWGAHGEFEFEAKKAGIQGTIIPLDKPMPARLKAALVAFNESHAISGHLERILGITVRWTIDSTEYQDAVKWSSERRARLALDKVQRLVIQRIFELQKANLVSTGKDS